MTGNNGAGTASYTAYNRSHTVNVQNKPQLHCSSDTAFRGDRNKYNPEELLVASLSSCHMLWYLHLCAEAGVVVTDYKDEAKGVMEESVDGSGRFREVVLYPQVTVTDLAMLNKAMALHQEANRLCFIANSVNFKVCHLPKCKVA